MAVQDGGISRYDRPYEIVSEQIEAMSDRADSALAKAYDTLEQLKAISADLDNLPPTPAIEIPEPEFPEFVAPTPPNPNQFGSISGINLPDLDTGLGSLDVADIELTDPPAFTPSIVGITIPEAPGPIDVSGLPSRPEIAQVEIPDAPAITVPGVGNLVDIVIPEFTFPELPDFAIESPLFAGGDPADIAELDWEPPKLDEAAITNLRQTILAMSSGKFGIPKQVEEALFDSARWREDRILAKAISDASHSFSARGYELPPGAQAKRTDALIEESILAANARSREILIKAAEWQIENLRQAVAQGIALESAMIGHFDNLAARSLDAAKFRAEADRERFNASLALFNARQNAYQAEANVYQTKLNAELSKLEVFKAQIEGEQAKATLNEQTVRIFTARLEALTSEIEIYKARMSGAQIKSEINRSEIEAYRAEIQAYAETVGARKVEFDAYESRVKAEQAKVGIYEAETRAFAATVQAYESANNIKLQSVRAKIEIMGARVQQYTAQLEAEKARVQAELSNIQAMTSAYQADVTRYSAEIEAASSQHRLAQTHIEANLRNNLAYYEIELKKYDASMERLIQQVQIQSEAIKAAGQMSSQLAAGAMAATNVSASMSGAANISSTDTMTTSRTETHNYTY